MQNQQPEFQLKSSLRTHLLQRILLPVGILLLITSFVLFWATRDELSQSVQQTYETRIQLAVNNVHRYMKSKRDLLRSLSRIDTAIYFNPKKLKKHFVKQRKVTRTYNVYMGFANGKFISSGKWKPPPDFDPRKRIWYTQAIQSKKVITTKPYLSVTGKRMFVTMAKAIYHKKKLVGVLALDLKIKSLFRTLGKLSRFKEGVNFAVIDSDGKYLVHKEKDKVMKESFTDSKYGDTLEAFLETEEKFGIQESGDMNILFGRVRTIDWYMMYYIPSDEIDGPVNRFRNISVLIIVIALGILGVVVLYTGQQIINPVQVLVGGADKLKNQDDFVPLDVARSDELGYLTHTFNGMAKSIREYSQNLEKMVADRTQALSEALDRINADLETATIIQQGFIPQDLAIHDGLLLHGWYEAMDAVGGDYFDIFQLGLNRFGFVIADVSGHGTGAALITAMAKLAFTNQSHNYKTSGAVMQAVNKALHNSIGELEPYVTGFYCILDLDKRNLQFTNAGHNGAYLVRPGSAPKFLASQDMILAVAEFDKFNTYKVDLKKGDKVVLYTDGVVECKNPAGDFMGDENFTAVLTRLADSRPEDFVAGIKDEVHRFRDGAAVDDDCTIYVIEVL